MAPKPGDPDGRPPRRRPPTLQEAQQADVERGWGQVEDQLLPWDTRLAHKAKRWTRTIAAVTGLLTVAGGAVGTVKGYVTRLWHVIRVKPPSPPDLPPHTDVASTAVDRVAHPVAPPGSDPEKH